MRSTFAIVTTLLICATSWAAGKGPIQIKPAKTFPFVINQPGSCQLINNITVTTDAAAIQINASNVTLDLNGFTVQGNGSGVAIGINSTNTSHITVRNGVVRGFAITGVRLSGSGHVVCDVKVDGNGVNGIEVFQSSTVERCIATGNGVDGITAGQDCSIKDNVCTGNGSDGVNGSQACAILQNTCNGNGDAGIRANQGSTVLQNTCSGNGISGIRALGQCLVQQNHCSLNDSGISTGDNNSIVENTCIQNNTGMKLGSGTGNYVAQNKLIGNGATITSSGSNTLGSGDLANVAF